MRGRLKQWPPFLPKVRTVQSHGSHQDWKTGETWKMGRHFPVGEKSGNFTQNTGKIRKNFTGKLEKNTGKVREICQPVIVKTLQIWYHTLNKNTGRNTGKLQKILEKSGKFVSPKKWEP